MEKFLIAGLGNIGVEYAGTRHNIGFDILDAFAAKHGVVFRNDRLAAVAEVRLKGRIFLCVKPSTYMNLSGKAVKYWMEKEGIPLEHLLVLVDDLALPLEKIRIRASGSSGGHNGLKSIEEILGTDKYAKLRFGIGSNYPKGRQVDFVLDKWTVQEASIVKIKIAACVEVIETVALAGIATAMNQANNLIFNV